MRRIAWYAFGVAGDIDIAATRLTPEHIQDFHQKAEQLEAAWQEQAEKQAALRLNIPPSNDGTPRQAYMTYLPVVLGKSKAAEDNPDERNALIALRMRIAGYDQAETADAVRYNSQFLDRGREESRHDAQKIAAWVFGHQGDAAIMKIGWLREELEYRQQQAREPQRQRSRGMGMGR